jgi:tRNA dimethylallyltransferase
MASAKKPMVVVITGPTAVGKTAVSIQTALATHGEIISADSMQIYRQMNIGTAKPPLEEQQGVHHHLLDFLDPAQRFTVADFQQLALEKICEIHQRNALPIVTGGTGLYIHSLLYRLDFTDVEIDSQLRRQLEDEAAAVGAQAMHHRLRLADPAAAERIHPHNLKRVIRALEVSLNAADGIRDFSRELEINQDYDFRVFVINEDRESLYDRINQRVDMMLAQGLEAEVRHLMSRGFDVQLPAMQGVGYKEMIRYIQGEIGYEDAVEIIKRNSRRYAKRQLTWFKKLPQAQWIHLNHHESRDAEVSRTVELILHQLSEPS